MRGQGHSIEAIVASLLLLTGLVFALQVTAVTPLSASTSSQHLENQHEAAAEGVLSTATDAGALKAAVLLWSPSDGNGDGQPEFRCARSQPSYAGNPETGGNCANGPFGGAFPPTRFGAMLEDAFGDGGLAYNVHVGYRDGDHVVRQRMVYVGEPSDNAVTATTYVTLFDDDELLAPDGSGGVTPTGVRVDDPAAKLYDTERRPGRMTDQHVGEVFNVVRVEVTVWRQ